jgi:hypothetical protein
MLQLKEHTPTLSSFVFSPLNSHLNLSKSLGVHEQHTRNFFGVWKPIFIAFDDFFLSS